MRTPLKMHSMLPLTIGNHSIDVEILQPIGSGAHCLAYEVKAIISDGIPRTYRLKECYPDLSSCHRTEYGLMWEDPEEKERALGQFSRSVEILEFLRTSESLGNDVPSTILCKSNGTLYSLTEVNHGQTYDNHPPESILQLLETVLRLTRIVGRIHEMGYLHLDFKPSNFLVRCDPDVRIWLFDADSLTPISAIRNQEISCLSCSRGWAAPELLRFRLKEICPATDLFSIGAILFQKLFGRRVTADDMTSIVSWSLDIPILRNVNPKLKTLLSDILHRTLSAYYKSRYQTAEALISALEEACAVARDKIYLTSKYPPSPTFLIGRLTALQEIHARFFSKDSVQKAVSLHGVGGIGKSTLAAAYAHRYLRSAGNGYRGDYDTVLFLRYKGSLKRLLEEIPIHGFEGTPEDKLKELSFLLNERILLIIDNFDIDVGDDPDFPRMLEDYNAHFLFTSRTDWSEYYPTVQVPVLSASDLELIFCHHSGLSELYKPQREVFQDLLKQIGHNTFVTELLAKQIRSSGWSLAQLQKKLSDGLIRLRAEKVQVNKDGNIKKATLPEFLRLLFRVEGLTDKQLRVLHILYMFRFLRIDLNSYRALSDEENVDDLNTLVQLGWVQGIPDIMRNLSPLDAAEIKPFVEKHPYLYPPKYSLHPLVQELVTESLTANPDFIHEIYDWYMDRFSVNVFHKLRIDYDDFHREIGNCMVSCLIDIPRCMCLSDHILFLKLMQFLFRNTPKTDNAFGQWYGRLFDHISPSIERFPATRDTLEAACYAVKWYAYTAANCWISAFSNTTYEEIYTKDRVLSKPEDIRKFYIDTSLEYLEKMVSTKACICNHFRHLLTSADNAYISNLYFSICAQCDEAMEESGLSGYMNSCSATDPSAPD